MHNLSYLLISASLIGLGATLTFDLWGLVVKHAFKLPPSNICLVGRWVGYMPEGVFKHANIAATPEKRGECTLGWIAHYLIGITFAIAFLAIAGSGWLQHPALAPALAFGLVTVLAPFLVMQPLFGLGLASARAPNPTLARVRTLMNHAAYGVGLYLFAWMVGPLMAAVA